MTVAGTIAVTNNSTSLTGTGTTFSTDIKAGDFIVATVGGVAYTMGVQSVDSDTAITTSQAFQGPTSSGLSWQPVPLATLNLITSALANQLGYAVRGFNLDKDNWQNFYTKNDDITINLPSSTSVTGPSWPKMQQTISDAINTIANKANNGANSDITSLSGLTTPLSLAQGGTGQKTPQAFLTAAGMVSTYNSFTLPFTDRSMRVVVDSVVTTTNASGEGTVSFANSFPNVCLACIPVLAYQAGISIMVINYAQTRTTSFDYTVFNGTNRQTNSTVRINYIAIGF